jgi:transposase
MDDKKLFTKLLKLELPWFISRVLFNETDQRIDIYVEHEPDIRARCPVCDQFFGVYDHAPERIFRHLDTCHMQTYIHVRLPRVNCPKHGVKQIISDFGDNGSEMTHAFESHVLRLLQECSMSATAALCGLSWDQSMNAMKRAVARGQARKEHRIPRRIGVDEKSFARRYKYETLVYDIDEGTVEFIHEDREQESLEAYYKQFTPEQREQVEAVAMDMWDAFIAATKAYIPNAEKKIVFDRFHIMQHVLKAVDAVRKQEHKELLSNGNNILKGTKYLWLWNQENIPEWRREEFEELRAQDLKVCRANAIKENLRHMWDYRYEALMRKYFQKWYFWATHCRLKPIKKAAQTLKVHLDNIITYARHRITNALAESMNAKIEKVKALQTFSWVAPIFSGQAQRNFNDGCAGRRGNISRPPQ